MLGRGMDEPHAQVPTEGLEQFPPKRPALVKHHPLGNDLPLAHGRTQGSNGGAWIDVVKEITEDIPPGIIVQQGQLIQLPPSRLVKDFLQTVAMPKTMRVMTLIKAPLGPRRGWRLDLLPGMFHPLDRRRADLHVRDVLEFPGQAFRAQLRFGLDEAPSFLLHLPCEAPGGPAGGWPFGQARQRIAVAQALNGAGGWRCRASLGMDLRRTPGRMTLGQLPERLCLRGRQPIDGTLRPRALIRQCSLEG